MAGYALDHVRARPLARIDFRVKLAILLVASTLIFAWNAFAAQAAMLAATIGFLLAAGIGARTIGRLARITAPALVLVILIQGLLSPFGITPVFVVPRDIPWLGSATVFTVEGLLFGLVVCCRILVPMLVFQYVFITTGPNEMVVGLTRIGVPYRVAVLVSTTFRFVPLLLDEFNMIRDAQRLRGIDLDGLGVFRKLVALGRMLVPLITGSIARGQAMEIALQARAFTGSGERTFLHPTRDRLSAAERVAIAAALAVLAAAVAARLALGWGGRVL